MKNEFLNKMFERVRDLLLHPRETWQKIKEENITAKDLVINFAAPMALIPSLSNLIGISIIGIRVPGGVARGPFFEALVGAVFGYIISIIGLFIGAWIIKWFSQHFASRSDFDLSMKLAVYSLVPMWLVGIFSLFPGLSILSILGLYGIYLLAIGLPILLDTPHDKVFIYTLTIVVSGIVVSVLTSIIVVGLFFGPMYMRMLAV